MVEPPRLLQEDQEQRILQRVERSPNQVPCLSDSLCFSDEICRFISAIGFRSDESQVFLSCSNDIKPVLQCGLPCCGIVAISMAYQVLNGTTADDLLEATTGSGDPLRILATAEKERYTKQGEILSADTMLQLCKDTLGCTGSVLDVSELTLDMIIQSVYSRKPILVPYDSDKDHTPYLADGHQAHWCVIVGVVIQINSGTSNLQELLMYCKKDLANRNHFILQLTENQSAVQIFSVINKTHVVNVFAIARHGKSRHLGLWELDRLRESNRNLKELGPQRNPAEFVVPVGGLAECLQSKVVVLENL